MKPNIIHAAALVLAMGAPFHSAWAQARPLVAAPVQQTVKERLAEQTRDYVQQFAVMRFWEAVVAMGPSANLVRVQAEQQAQIGVLAEGRMEARKALNAIATARLQRSDDWALQREALVAEQSKLTAAITKSEADFGYAREYDLLSDAATLLQTPKAEAYEPVAAARRSVADRMRQDALRVELRAVEFQLAAGEFQEAAFRRQDADETQAWKEADARLKLAIDALSTQPLVGAGGQAQLLAAKRAESQAVAAMNASLQELARLR